MKKWMALFLALSLLAGVLPMGAAAAEPQYMDVVREDAPIRRSPGEKGEVVHLCREGETLKTQGSTYNRYFHKWYEVEVEGETCYIYSDNVQPHIHCYRMLPINGVEFSVCTCGCVTAKADTPEAQAWADTSKAKMSMVVAALPYADGYLPVGDLVAVGLVALGICAIGEAAVPTVEDLMALITDASFEDYLDRRTEDSCPAHSFRRVTRWSGGLRYVDDRCLDRTEAYLYVRLLGKDVYTEEESDALLLAAMHGAMIMERDCPKPDKDLSVYYYHYHLGANREYKGHIFFGVNDRGEYPS